MSGTGHMSIPSVPPIVCANLRNRLRAFSLREIYKVFIQTGVTCVLSLDVTHARLKAAESRFDLHAGTSCVRIRHLPRYPPPGTSAGALAVAKTRRTLS